MGSTPRRQKSTKRGKSTAGRLEHDNLLAALSWSAADSDSASKLLRLAGSLGPYWQARGLLVREGIGWLETALARNDALPSADRARALTWLGELEAGSGNIARVHVLERSVAEARAVGDQRLLSTALSHLGQAMLSIGRQAEARRLFEEALAVSHAADLPREVALNQSWLGVTLIAEGQLDVAEALLLESVALGRQAGYQSPVVWSLRALGELYRARGDFARGRSAASEGLAIARRMDTNLWSVSLLLLTLGDLDAADGDWTTAGNWYRQGLQQVGRTAPPDGGDAAGATLPVALRAGTTTRRRGTTVPPPTSLQLHGRWCMRPPLATRTSLAVFARRWARLALPRFGQKARRGQQEVVQDEQRDPGQLCQPTHVASVASAQCQLAPSAAACASTTRCGHGEWRTGAVCASRERCAYLSELPETREIFVENWGHPIFRVGPKDKMFASCSLPDADRASFGMKVEEPHQQALVHTDPRINVADYVGRHGWITIDSYTQVDWQLVHELVQESYLLNAPRRLGQQVHGS
jgi:tetratricopeptide (TPR) repeat protein/predicted DNA-binding protein (MmcQ/YjbR family)